jgi:hypothetical protein
VTGDVSKMPKFTVLGDYQQVDCPPAPALLNVDQIKMITEIRKGHCRIIFDPQFSFELRGDAADQFVLRLLAGSELADGTTTAEALERLKRL